MRCCWSTVQASIVRANDAAATLFGYSIDELRALHIEALVPDAVRTRHAGLRHAYEAAPVRRPMGQQMELSARRRDGSEVLVEIALSPVKAAGRSFVLAAIRGIGEYPRVKQALQRARHAEAIAQMGRLAVDSGDSVDVLREAPQAAALALDAPGRGAVRARCRWPTCRLRRCVRAGTAAAGRRRAGGARRAARPVGRQRPDAALVGAAGRPRAHRRRARSACHRGHGAGRRCRALPRLAGQPGDDGVAARGFRSGAAPRPAARSRGPAHRRHRARLQQPVDGDPGQSAGARRPALRQCRCAGAGPGVCGHESLAPRRRIDGQAARVFSAADAAAARDRRRRHVAPAGGAAAAHTRCAHPNRSECRGRLPALSG